MYDHIAGELIRRELTEAVVRAGGVGYSLSIPVTTYDALPSQGGVVLYVHMSVRENDIRLYGFFTEKERKLFRILMGAKGIGPSSALAIMSGARMEEIARAVTEEDHKALERIRGIGAKTARRIVAEIREDMSAFRDRYLLGGAVDSRGKDAVAALISLGLSRNAAEKGIEETRKEHPEASVEDLVRVVLRSSGG